MALESIPTPIDTSPSQLDRRTHQVLIALGVFGILSTMVMYAVQTGVYLEYLRLMNIDPFNYEAYIYLIDILQLVGDLYIIPAMMIALGFYAVIVSSGGRFSLIFVFIFLFPYTYNLYEELGSLFEYEFLLSLDTAIAISIAFILGMILLTTRYQIKKRLLLYFAIIMMLANPIVVIVHYFLVWVNISSLILGTQYFLITLPVTIVYYLRLVTIMVLFSVEFKRDNVI
ncbi:MAG: hypothetical protein ACFFE2_00270 [Candidatus Thorarchaeota archaeon]